MSRLIPATSYLILAMREKWLNLILDGKKTAEVRRTRPSSPCYMPGYLYLYHKGCIHGIAEVVGTDLFNQSGLYKEWVFAAFRAYGEKACLTRVDFFRYLALAKSPVVYLLGRVERFLKPIPVPCRPQSWQYATPELLDIINGKETK